MTCRQRILELWQSQCAVAKVICFVLYTDLLLVLVVLLAGTSLMPITIPTCLCNDALLTMTCLGAVNLGTAALTAAAVLNITPSSSGTYMLLLGAGDYVCMCVCSLSSADDGVQSCQLKFWHIASFAL